MYLKDRIRYDASARFSSGNNYNGSFPVGKNKKEICERFNIGKCTTGRSCKYDHRCKECGKWGHGAHICRKKLGNSSGNNTGGLNNSSNHTTPASAGAGNQNN